MFKPVHFLRHLFTKPARNPFEEHEAQVRAQLVPYFDDYEFWFAKLHNDVLQSIATYSEHPERKRPCADLEMLLLARLLADLRVCLWAAGGGYPLQAMTVASSAREVAFGLIFIGGSDERARKWTEHSHESRSYPSDHKTAIESAKGVLGFIDAEVSREYHVYTELCWGKHGNPILQREYGALDAQSFIEVQQQPYFSDRTIRFGRHALFHACRAVIFAARAFVKLHLVGLEDAQHLGVIESQFNHLGVRDRLMAP